MAVAELIVSRRALLGAACAAPLIRHPGLDPGSLFTSPTAQDREIPDLVRNDEGEGRGDTQSFVVTKWDRALSTFRHAEAALAAAEGADDALFDRVLGHFNNALRRLLRTPAPNLLALSRKIDLTVDHEIAELTGGDRCLAALKRDARRLCLSAPFRSS